MLSLFPKYGRIVIAVLRLPISIFLGSPQPSKERSIVIAEFSPGYCWKLIAEGLGQRRVSVVGLADVGPPLRKVQHSPRVEL